MVVPKTLAKLLAFARITVGLIVVQIIVRLECGLMDVYGILIYL